MRAALRKNSGARGRATFGRTAGVRRRRIAPRSSGSPDAALRSAAVRRRAGFADVMRGNDAGRALNRTWRDVRSWPRACRTRRPWRARERRRRRRAGASTLPRTGTGPWPSTRAASGGAAMPARRRCARRLHRQHRLACFRLRDALPTRPPGPRRAALPAISGAVNALAGRQGSRRLLRGQEGEVPRSHDRRAEPAV